MMVVYMIRLIVDILLIFE